MRRFGALGSRTANARCDGGLEFMAGRDGEGYRSSGDVRCNRRQFELDRGKGEHSIGSPGRRSVAGWVDVQCDHEQTGPVWRGNRFGASRYSVGICTLEFGIKTGRRRNNLARGPDTEDIRFAFFAWLARFERNSVWNWIEISDGCPEGVGFEGNYGHAAEPRIFAWREQVDRHE